MTLRVESRSVTIWSEGSRLDATVTTPIGAEGERPAILLCHGWGGLKGDLLHLYAKTFTEAGYVCLAFDYRGWGNSDGRIISTVEAAPLVTAGETTAKVYVLREIVDPVDQMADIRACFAWLLTEDRVDPRRVGLWGSSLAGGHVTFLAGNEPRVKAVVAQIGIYGLPPMVQDYAYMRMADKARARIAPPVPQGIDRNAPTLRGTPDIARLWIHEPLKTANNIRCPILFIDAEFEEYGTPAEQGGAAYTIVKDRGVITERITFPCTHYKIYDEYLTPARQSALDWFDMYL